ncbi:preprotein translocase subunit SecE [Oceanivirga miroungae]|uniref:preprotein translocase subunit SecE n=1 Tax=Oceanivirga miroungae TaxID=1130046 RepID=UPI0018D17679|nr:preprotein translocase subunit SecE [Oceanivirga miroungae]
MKDKEKKSLLTNIINEYKKVTWASKSTVFQVTVIVLLITLFIAVMVTAFDFSFNYLLSRISEILRRVI